ncbi:MAG TPA: ABC transporter permease [Kofleriaceae bacterium]|jgi:putative ABC transport system permease protein
MLGYYFDLALRSLKRHRGLTVLMIVAIAFGVGASMTTLTVLHVLSADPIPGKSDKLFYVQIDPRHADSFTPGEEPNDQMTRFDSEAMLRDARAPHQAMMTGGRAAVELDHDAATKLLPFDVEARWTSADFFTMFDVKFLAGAPWTAADDQKAARVVVITKALAEKLFGSTQILGRPLRVEGTEMRIVGVIDAFRPVPHFYDLNTDNFGLGDQVFVPFSTSVELKLHVDGSMNCWGEDNVTDAEALNAPCDWIQYWVELDTADQVAGYRDYLVSYSEDQAKVGRFQRPPNVRLRDVPEHLDHNHVVPNDVKLQTWIALGFLLVCLVNTVGLLLTKFLRRSGEIGVRRALGASKRAIFVQLLIESGSIGLVGGVLGLGLAWLGLLAVRHQPTSYADLAHLDLRMLALTFALAIVTSVLAGILPAWRGCQIAPAIQLKSN